METDPQPTEREQEEAPELTEEHDAMQAPGHEDPDRIRDSE